MFQQISGVTFLNQTGDVICEGESWGLRIERGKPHEKGKYNRLALKTYTKQDLEEVVRGYDQEKIRGGTPQYWEDISVGDELPSVLKGPYTPTHAIAYEIARGGSYIKSHGFWYDYLKRHPAIGVLNEQGIPETPERVHWDSAFARRVGVPAAFDYGPERIAWLGHLLTNWMGDDGFLRRLQVRFKRFNLMGDLTWCKGCVAGKEEFGGEFLAHCDIWCEDHRGEPTAEGKATVALPSRSGWLPAQTILS